MKDNIKNKGPTFRNVKNPFSQVKHVWTSLFIYTQHKKLKISKKTTKTVLLLSVDSKQTKITKITNMLSTEDNKYDIQINY